MSEETHATAAKMSDAIRKLDNEQVLRLISIFLFHFMFLVKDFGGYPVAWTS